MDHGTTKENIFQQIEPKQYKGIEQLEIKEEKVCQNLNSGVVSDLKGKIITIDGIVGAGKSTFCKILKKTLESLGFECVLFDEYVNEDYLNLYLKDMKKYAFAFQTLMLQQKAIDFRKAVEDKKARKTVIMDRSIYGDSVFEWMCFSHGNINDEEHEAYLSEFVKNKALVEESLDVIVYLSVDTTVAKRRTARRNRSLEVKSYDDVYFSKLATLYKDEMRIVKTEGHVQVHVVPYNVGCEVFADYDGFTESVEKDCIRNMLSFWEIYCRDCCTEDRSCLLLSS